MLKATTKKSRWSEPLMRLYQKWPAAFQSKDWDRIKTLVADGDIAGAEALAKEHEQSHKSIRAQNVMARRIRIQRVELFKIQRDHIDKIKSAFKSAAVKLSEKMARQSNKVAAIAPMRAATREVIVELRRNLNTIITDLIWKSIILGVRNMGEAIKPILRDNKESFVEELSDIQLIEDRLTLGLSKNFASRAKGNVVLDSEKWQNILDGIYLDIVKSNNQGLNLAQNVWDLTARAENDLKRIVASDIASGTPSRTIADHISRYLYLEGDAMAETGPGIYRSPMKNAMRVARTETNRAYTKATAAWAENKPWVKGIQITLSPAHDQEDDCDDEVANQPEDGYSPEEFADIVPIHPHCMCFGTYVIDENYLTSGASSGGEEDTNE